MGGEGEGRRPCSRCAMRRLSSTLVRIVPAMDKAIKILLCVVRGFNQFNNI